MCVGVCQYSDYKRRGVVGSRRLGPRSAAGYGQRAPLRPHDRSIAEKKKSENNVQKIKYMDMGKELRPVPMKYNIGPVLKKKK